MFSDSAKQYMDANFVSKINDISTDDVKMPGHGSVPQVNINSTLTTAIAISRPSSATRRPMSAGRQVVGGQSSSSSVTQRLQSTIAGVAPRVSGYMPLSMVEEGPAYVPEAIRPNELPVNNVPYIPIFAQDTSIGESSQLKPYQIFQLYAEGDELKFNGFVRLLSHLEIPLNSKYNHFITPHNFVHYLSIISVLDYLSM